MVCSAGYETGILNFSRSYRWPHTKHLQKGKGAGMFRADLEAAGILKRDKDGELIITDEYGLVYDFHSLRATFASLLNKVRVPLATAQRLMRHSDPKLTSNIYTHVLIDDKAEEPAKLPVIRPLTTNQDNVAKTGTLPFDSPSSQEPAEALLEMGSDTPKGRKITVPCTDTNGPDLDGFHWTYADEAGAIAERTKNAPAFIKTLAMPGFFSTNGSDIPSSRQLGSGVEQRFRKAQVVGSNPTVGSIFKALSPFLDRACFVSLSPVPPGANLVFVAHTGQIIYTRVRHQVEWDKDPKQKRRQKIPATLLGFRPCL